MKYYFSDREYCVHVFFDDANKTLHLSSGPKSVNRKAFKEFS